MTGVDIAFGSLHYCRKKLSTGAAWCCGDAEHPPFRPATFEGLVAASMLQWTSRPDRTMATLASLVQPGGYLVFSFFTEGAFRELYETRKRYNLPIPASLYREATVEPMLRRLGMTPLTIVPFSETVYFSSARELLRHLSAIGSTGTASRPMTRRNLQIFCDDLENGFGTDQGVPLTYKALFGAARKGDG